MKTNGQVPGSDAPGSGGALTKSVALVLWAMLEEECSRFIELYIGESGLGHTLGRTHINSSDLPPDHYSFDKVDGDPDLLHFYSNVTRDTKAPIPFHSSGAAGDSEGRSGAEVACCAVEPCVFTPQLDLDSIAGSWARH